jgi:DNA-binding XRE family transcriptional regulator
MPSELILRAFRRDGWIADERSRGSASAGYRGSGAFAPQKKRLTQEQLAEAAGISYEHLNHVENYRAMPSLEVLDRIGRALGHPQLSGFLAMDPRGILGSPPPRAANERNRR